MNNLKKSLFLSAFFCALFGFFSLSQAQSKRIGIMVPQTGPSAKLGEMFLLGTQLAVQNHNISNANAIDVLVVDDGCSEELSRFAVEELTTANPPLSIATGFLCNESAYVAANHFKQTDLPILIAGAQSERLIKDRERNGWKLWKISPNDNDLASRAAHIFSRRWAGQPYAIVDDGTVSGRTLADNFRAGMEELGHPTHFNDNFRPTQSTQARLVRRLRKAGVTNVFLGADVEDIIMISKNAKELKFGIEIASSNSLAIMPFLPKNQRASSTLLAVLDQIEFNYSLSPQLTQKIQDMGLQPEAYIYRGYAAAQIAINAIGNTHKDTISNLSHGSFDTVLGQISFNNDGSNMRSPYALYQWTGSEFIQIAE